MFSFRQFIQEESVSKKPEYISLTIDEAIKVINHQCKNAFWMFNDDRPLFRGDPGFTLLSKLRITGCVAVDSSLTERKSRSAGNYYTIIIDNHPDYKNFPLRSRSFIAATTRNIASTYDSNVKIVIPFDDAKIGFVNNFDIWNVRVNFGGKMIELSDLNDFYDTLGIKETLESFEEFAKKLKSGDEKTIQFFDHGIGNLNLRSPYDVTIKKSFIEKLKDNFVKTIFSVYDLKNTKFDWYTTKDMPRHEKSEVWISGGILIFDFEAFINIRDSL